MAAKQVNQTANGNKEEDSVLKIAAELVIRMAFIVGVTMAVLYGLAILFPADNRVWEKVYNK